MRKTSYYQLSYLVFFLAVTGLLIFLNGHNYLKTPKNLAMSGLRPFQKSAQGFSNRINYYFNIVSSTGALGENNIKLKNENKKLLAENTKLKEVKRENDFLKKQLSVSSDENLDLVLADVIGREPESLGNYITISVGMEEGIEKEQAVIDAGGILIGRISEAFKNSSKVILVTDPQSSIDAFAQQTRTKGVAKGKFGTSVLMEMVSQNEKIEIGETVITAGIGEKMPKGLVIGKVKSVEESDSDVFKKVVLELSTDFRKIERVFVVVK